MKVKKIILILETTDPNKTREELNVAILNNNFESIQGFEWQEIKKENN